jgi:multidrug efflux pump subunit AcrA (membrane-fusion protein)
MASQLGGIELADFTSLAVETDVPEGRMHLVALDRPCEIVLDAFPDRRYRGRVTEIVPKVNRAKATVTVKVKFVDDVAGVLPDMSARVSFLQAELDAAKLKEPPKTVVPRSAVAEREGGKVVFVVEDGAVRMVPIELGPEFGDGFELAHGPDPGTKVVADPPADLRDGQKIKEQGG